MNSPSVNFYFENNNVAPMVSPKGVSNVLAVTTKGPFEEPILCETLSAFQKIFGKEIVPDGTVSNIERALKMGSKVRVCRVKGSSSSSPGYMKLLDINVTETPAVKASNIQANKFKIEAAVAGVTGNNLTYTIAVDGTGEATVVRTDNNIAITLLSTAKTVGDLITLLSTNDDIRAMINGTGTNATVVTAITNPTPLTGGADLISTTNLIKGSTSQLQIILVDPLNSLNYITLSYNITTKEYGSNIVSDYGYNLNRDFYLQFNEVIQNGISRVYVTQFTSFNIDNTINSNSVINTSLLLLSTPSVIDGVSPMVDQQSVIDFLQNTPNIMLSYLTSTSSGDGIPSYPNLDLDGSIDVIKEYNGWLGYVKIDSERLDTTKIKVINEGTNGGASSSATWISAYNKIKSENAYHLICSHMHQHIATDYVTTLKTIAESVVSLFDTELYIEIPKTNTDGTFRTAAETKSAVDTMKTIIGYHKNVAYFGGGIKLYNSDGILKKCDVLGTVIGLADVSADQYGPYYSFANQTRGLVPDAHGPVIENLGSPGMVDTLNQFAASRINIFIVKDTELAGAQTMLWHNLTSINLESSDRFLSVIGLQLYLKKTLKPRLEKYLEEPNTFSTWKDIYLSNKKVFDDLIGKAITVYTWIGDQDAKNYSQLILNTEAEVRQGKYKIKVSYKDIVTLQTIDIYLTIDAVGKTVSINL